MKISHIIGIVIIGVAIAIILSTANDTSEYVSFNIASEMAIGGSEKKVHVVGKLKKNNAGDILGMNYAPSIDPNYFEFVMVDNEEKEMKVVFPDAKPTDFEKSEQVVIIGKVKEDVFYASKILMKCPSKYQEAEVKVNT